MFGVVVACEMHSNRTVLHAELWVEQVIAPTVASTAKCEKLQAELPISQACQIFATRAPPKFVQGHLTTCTRDQGHALPRASPSHFKAGKEEQEELVSFTHADCISLRRLLSCPSPFPHRPSFSPPLALSAPP